MKQLKGWKLIAILAILCCTMVFVAACGSQGEQPASGDGEQGATQAASQEKMVRITGGFPLYADPAVGSNAIEAAVYFNIYDPLVWITTEGEIVPHIATEWDVSEDGLTYTFKIREGVKFHDGSTLDAEDVAFSMNRMLAIGQGFAYLYTPYVEEAIATDANTVEFHMKQTFGPFVSSLIRLSIVNKDLVMANIKADGPYGEFGDYGKDYLLTHDAGSGPYTMEEMKMEEHLLGKQFADYWQDWGPNAPEYFKIIASPDATTVRTLMARRELEIVDEWQSSDNLNAMAEIDGVEVPLISAGAMVNIEMNTKIAPTDDIHFRKAMAYLLDYEQAKTAIYPGTKQAVGPVSSVYAGHDDSLFQYSYNEEKALEELKQSKYYNELANYPVTIAWSADVPDEEKLCLLLQQTCAKVGITVNIAKTPFASLIAQVTDPETTPHMTIMYPGDSYSEAGSVLALRYHSTTAGTFTQFEWLQDPEIDAAIEQALSTMDETSRLEQYKAIQKTIVDLCPSIWVVEWPEMRAYQSSYLNWPEANAAKEGTLNCPVMGRAIYFRTMEIFPDKKAELLAK